MIKIIERLRALARHEHNDLSVAEDAADMIELLQVQLEHEIQQRYEEHDMDTLLFRELIRGE